MMVQWPLIGGFMLCLGGLVSPIVADADWPHWRGPNRDSIARPSGRLLAWPQGGLTRLWVANVGVGFSSMAVSQGRLFTMGNRGNQDTVYCLDATSGQYLWTFSYACELDPNLYQGGPSATPTVEGGVVYTLSKFGHLFCFNVTNGAVVWRTNLISDLGLQKPEWGFAGSPVIEGPKLLLNAGGHGLALDKTNGQVIWLSDTRRAGYSTLVPFDLDGVRAGVMLGYTNVICVALDDGHLLSQVFWRSAFDMNCPDPIIHNGRILATSVSKSARLIQPENGQFVAGFPTVDLKTHLSPGVVISNHLYAFHGDAEQSGALRCVDLQTGAVRWTTPLPVGSLIAADGKLIVLTGGGELILAQVTPSEFAPISRFRALSGRCWTMPALASDRLFLRNAYGDVAAFSLVVESPPRLQVREHGSALEITWPTNAAEFDLESSFSIAPGAVWGEARETPTIETGMFRVSVSSADSNRFFRLKKP